MRVGVSVIVLLVLFVSGAWAEDGAALETALGLTRADRRLIQSSLAAQGFDPGPADGVFGRRTRAAIGQWQAARGGEPTGYLTAEAARSLLALAAKPERESEETAALDVSEQDRQAEAEAERKRQRQQRQAEAERQRRESQPGARLRDCETCPELVVVPSGSFMMGSPDSEWGRFNNEGPQRRVAIMEPFAVGVYEVTFGEWDACLSEGGCNGYQPHGEGWGRGGRPVINVSWEDARAYVTWLSQRTGKQYRLLSESEWEYVARAGTTEPFHTGATISADQANYDSSYTYGSGQKGRYRGRTVQAGTFSPNAFGLHEVHGNVWEWTQDCWNEDYTGAPTDSRAWETGECEQRVLRGGSWGDVPWLLRSADRGKNEPGIRDPKIGFRIARTLSP